jgi:AbiV family abortive infection protein
MRSGDRVELPDDAKRAHDGALAHADDLLCRAQLLIDDFAHLAYQLAALAPEEVGRATLLIVEAVAVDDDHGPRRFQRAAEDHVRKLFWALWRPSFRRQLITGEQIEQTRGLAKAIHETRLGGLYYRGPDTTPPREAIDVSEARTVLELARSRLALARAPDWVQPDTEHAAHLAWFIEASADAETRRIVVGNASMRSSPSSGACPGGSTGSARSLSAPRSPAGSLPSASSHGPSPAQTNAPTPSGG